MKKIILVTIIAAAVFVSAQNKAQAFSESEYKMAVLNLFLDFIYLKESGVLSPGGTYFGHGGSGGKWLEDIKKLDEKA